MDRLILSFVRLVSSCLSLEIIYYHLGWLPGGLETRMPVLGLTIGIAFLARTAEG